MCYLCGAKGIVSNFVVLVHIKLVWFLVDNVLNLPISANLHILYKRQTVHCPLYGGRGFLELPCPKALAEVHYCWLHGQVLKAVVCQV